MRLIHRLILLRYGIPPSFVLNRGPASSNTGASEPVAADLQRIINAMKAEAFDLDRGWVDYSRLRASSAHAEYGQCALRLRSFDPATLSGREERLAFWIKVCAARSCPPIAVYEP